MYRLQFWDRDFTAWPSQASHFLHRLGITSNLEEYVVVNSIYFEFAILLAPTAPKGFLFLGPAKDFRTGPSKFAWPECPAYWSLDPLGAERIDMNQAETVDIGFPSIQLSTRLEGKFWDASVYAGLVQFYKAKGFDPESLDVARRLGHPLYHLCNEDSANTLFAHSKRSPLQTQSIPDSRN
ncbi:hypothetical protein C8R45DRAFT_916971 [Mycena sanguinolenta]|nr:hypothetical protein C8R45DRAFT_916971 [Mycena sanguinolenta]